MRAARIRTGTCQQQKPTALRQAVSDETERLHLRQQVTYYHSTIKQQLMHEKFHRIAGELVSSTVRVHLSATALPPVALCSR